MSRNPMVTIEIGKYNTLVFVRYISKGHFDRGIRRKPSQASRARLRRLLDDPRLLYDDLRKIYGWRFD